MSYLLSVDPGLSKGVGLALFESRPKWELVDACFLKGSPDNTLDGYIRTAREVPAWVYARTHPAMVTRVVVEWPQVYSGHRGKGDPKWLLDLAAVDCFICAQFPGARLERYLPKEWKGSGKASKGTVAEKAMDATRRRVERTLSPQELKNVVWPAPSLVDNVYEAVGIGLKAVGRFEPIRIIAR